LQFLLHVPQFTIHPLERLRRRNARMTARFRAFTPFFNLPEGELDLTCKTPLRARIRMRDSFHCLPYVCHDSVNFFVPFTPADL
jgi:hypothetical protein